MSESPALVTENTSNRLSGVLTAKSRVPSGESAKGRTCALSNVMNAGDWAAAVKAANNDATAHNERA
ncbi:hypothetical protein GCM10012319_00320 [Comamonas sp. KCTC 72670]|nr:hypothetical protein GCM10012319_00320 [Comamonas sp. KCTC 72670]